MNATMDWTAYSVKLNIVFFPLTYHRNSFEIAWGAQWLWARYGDPLKIYKYINITLHNWEALGTSNTMHLSTLQVQQAVADLIVAGMPEISRKELIAGMNDSTYDSLARLMWKYGCSKGVMGAPTHFGNDFEFDAYGWTGADWTALVHKYGCKVTEDCIQDDKPNSLCLEDLLQKN